MFIATAVNQIVDLQFKWAVEAATKTGGLEKLTTVFGNFYSVMGLLAFLFQIFFTQRIHRRCGSPSACALPTSVAVSTVLLLLAYGPLALAPSAAAYILALRDRIPVLGRAVAASCCSCRCRRRCASRPRPSSTFSSSAWVAAPLRCCCSRSSTTR
jgi:hypothetical protein